jgi:carboxyl-terminal processing protease
MLIAFRKNIIELFMKKLMMLVMMCGMLFSDSLAQSTGNTLVPLKPKQEHPREAILITQFLGGYHYNKLRLNDSISAVVYDNLFSDLDGNRAYFLQKEVDGFSNYRTLLDDQIQEGDLSFGFAVFTAYREQALERIQFVYEILEDEFDFGKEEYYDFDRQGSPWPKNEREQDELWRKIIKNQALTYKLSGREWADIQKSLTDRYKRVEKALYQYTSEDVFQLYMNAFTTAYDPHTNYFSPQDAEDFQIDMSLSLEGIGARLMQQLDYTVVSDIVPGGPAYQGKELEANDKIIGVAQGDDGEFEDVIGWRINEVVRKIRGPKGTVVRLQVLKNSKGLNAVPEVIRIVRDKIKLEEQEAKAEVIPYNENGKSYNLGVITIPSFYINFDERARGVKDYKSTTRDVKNLIEELKGKGIDGLMIDLRYNGGGSLDEAIELSGLFIPDGPMVQVRDMRDQVDKLNDPDNGKVFYNGPLTVLVNRYSASASEIFAGAIQDYKRGVIVGENSFGKGTVQNIVDLGPQLERQMSRMIAAYQQNGDMRTASELKQLRTYLNDNKIDLGQLKMTMAKFYRVTGNSTQRVGVSPDVHFPTAFAPNEVGESSQPNALPWDEILSAQFKPTNQINQQVVDQLNELYRQHLNSDPDLKKLVTEIERIKKDRQQKSVSLNLETRRNARLDEDELEGEVITAGDVQEESQGERLSKDPYLKEALRLLIELSRKSIG